MTMAETSRNTHARRYEFEETGVGCAEHSELDCLCDVDLARYPVTPLEYPPGEVLYSRLAADLCIKEFDKITWEGWAGWLCTITDEAAKAKVSALVSVLAEYKDQEGAAPSYSGDQRSFLQKAYPTLLAAGYDTEHCANILNTTTQTLFNLISPRGLDVESLAVLEFMLQDGSLSITEMTKELGAPRYVVQAHADRMGVTPPLGAKNKAQQPHVIACILKWNAEGLSSRKVVEKVLEETGVKVSPQHVLRTVKAVS